MVEHAWYKFKFLIPIQMFASNGDTKTKFFLIVFHMLKWNKTIYYDSAMFSIDVTFL